MDEQKQREIASKGGQASSGNFKNDPARAAEAGRKGGHDVPAEERSFAKDHELAADAGRKGGEHSHGGQSPGSHHDNRTTHGQHGASRQGGQGNFAQDRERASEAGRKGGEHSHDKR